MVIEGKVKGIYLESAEQVAVLKNCKRCSKSAVMCGCHELFGILIYAYDITCKTFKSKTSNHRAQS